MFMPGQSPLLDALLDRAQQNDIYVRGVVSTMMPSTNGDIVSVGGEVVKSGSPPQSFPSTSSYPTASARRMNRHGLMSSSASSRSTLRRMMAIVHSKTIVIDPFSDDCTVITGSHNFSAAASEKNDENLVIVRGNKKLAQAYALHINGVYDHYSWRGFRGSGGNPDQIYCSTAGSPAAGKSRNSISGWKNPFRRAVAAVKGGGRAVLVEGLRKRRPPKRLQRRHRRKLPRRPARNLQKNPR